MTIWKWPNWRDNDLALLLRESSLAESVAPVKAADTDATSGALKAIKFDAALKSLKILDQLQLPHTSTYIDIESSQDGWDAIRTMKVRGAPAIAIVAMLSLHVDLCRCWEIHRALSPQAYHAIIIERLSLLKTSRPTAVNLFQACKEVELFLMELMKLDGVSCAALKLAVQIAAEGSLEKDLKDNRLMGSFGADWILSKSEAAGQISVLTHCNTGSLATAGYGTALGVVRRLNELKRLNQVFMTETRPYNQGSRLTAYEAIVDKLPGVLVGDSMASYLLSMNKDIKAVIVGADRVAANGDTANKVGTYQLAITAKYHGVLMIVVAPSTSIDLQTSCGADIEVEQRKSEEFTRVSGLGDDGEIHSVSVAAKGISVWNPSFDVTPASLIDAIVTEQGVIVREPGSDVFKIKEFLK